MEMTTEYYNGKTGDSVVVTAAHRGGDGSHEGDRVGTVVRRKAERYGRRTLVYYDVKVETGEVEEFIWYDVRLASQAHFYLCHCEETNTLPVLVADGKHVIDDSGFHVLP